MYWIAGIFAVLLTALSARHGYRSRRALLPGRATAIGLGVPDQPPLLARAMSAIDANSVLLLRFPATMTATAVVICAGLTARELGGGRRPGDPLLRGPGTPGRIDKGLNIRDIEQGRAIIPCRAPRRPWSEMWPAVRRLG
ncbi:hypothetical protein [Nocardia niigatensis]|uniref:hypothetical protein n=1 Tax=Nocardia niigatensis TaxID=209249 RepID=UPI0002EB459B|nr:hypothetical protein [Nocardia niigatensis]